MLNSRALTKLQSLALIAIVTTSVIVGGAAYVLWSGVTQPAENIRIGICGDLDMGAGRSTLRGATLAAEQINANGGILGHRVTIVAEDDDSETPPYDVATATNALTKLITVDKADYVIATGGLSSSIANSAQDIVSQHKKIMFTTVVATDQFTQRIFDNYDKYKYVFRTNPANATSVSANLLENIKTVGTYTGFTKIALLFQDFSSAKTANSDLNKTLPDNGFEIVYNNVFSRENTDFTSYFSAAEAAGAQIIVPYIAGAAGVSFAKEWFERKSPTVIWGVMTAAGNPDFWNLTEGKCSTISAGGSVVVSGFPLTNHTLSTRQSYIERWGEMPSPTGVAAYDTLRFILADAINRAKTTETEEVVAALERTDIETSSSRHFVFTSSHDIMRWAAQTGIRNYENVLVFQWQDGVQLPVYPQEMMEEAGATYKYPPWQGPWNSK